MWFEFKCVFGEVNQTGIEHGEVNRGWRKLDHDSAEYKWPRNWKTFEGSSPCGKISYELKFKDQHFNWAKFTSSS